MNGRLKKNCGWMVEVDGAAVVVVVVVVVGA